MIIRYLYTGGGRGGGGRPYLSAVVYVIIIIIRTVNEKNWESTCNRCARRAGSRGCCGGVVRGDNVVRRSFRYCTIVGPKPINITGTSGGPRRTYYALAPLVRSIVREVPTGPTRRCRAGHYKSLSIRARAGDD